METKKYDVFISYSRKDTAVADRICASFESAGISYFIDRQGLGGGMEFPNVLAEAIMSSRLFLFLASKNSYLSQFTNSEVMFAFNQKKHNFILPYIIDGSLLPLNLQLLFSTINCRNINDHPIDSTLINDVLRLLGRCNTLQTQPSIIKQNPPEGSLLFTAGLVTFTMVFVRGGRFMMGAADNDGEARSDEKPQHWVELSDFYIGETVVTQELWKAVMHGNPSRFKGDNLPVECVAWDCDDENMSVQSFLRRINEKLEGVLPQGHLFRLPSEAEWEYAARGGLNDKGFKYSGSNNINDVAWYYENSGLKTHPVKHKDANELGLYDMCGNVYEWCQDLAYDYPRMPKESIYRIMRGGSWNYIACDCRVSSRLCNTPLTRDHDLGFRLAL